MATVYGVPTGERHPSTLPRIFASLFVLRLRDRALNERSVTVVASCRLTAWRTLKSRWWICRPYLRHPVTSTLTRSRCYTADGGCRFGIGVEANPNHSVALGSPWRFLSLDLPEKWLYWAASPVHSGTRTRLQRGSKRRRIRSLDDISQPHRMRCTFEKAVE